MKFVKFIPILAGIAVGIWRALVLSENGHGLASIGNCFALIALGFLITFIWIVRETRAPRVSSRQHQSSAISEPTAIVSGKPALR